MRLIMLLPFLPLVLLVWRIRLTRREERVRRPPRAHTNADGSAKRSYRWKRSAVRAARKYEQDFGGRIAVYRCRRRFHWHFGHKR